MNALKLDSFKGIREISFVDKHGVVLKYTELDIGTEKLRVKHYKALKQNWSRIRDGIKNGSRLFPDKEP